ncbi:MAG TPA: glycosyltransferase family 4 protein [Verrucomicrobiae bacterium]|nr:glycosyltransferase family 4 protein [Verrucomicrobiae bacterium]
MHVAFVNENTLGHTAYLPAFARELRARPDLGITPHLLDVTPLPGPRERRANFSVPGLRRWGLDFHNARWRLAVSGRARELADELRARQPLDALVINTQSVGLKLLDLAETIPTFICLDATFEQLARGPWFAPNAVTKWFHPLTLAPLRWRERRLFQIARGLFPWSENARQSLLAEYAVAPGKIRLLPPSIALPPRKTEAPPSKARPQILFVGGDFRRKGGGLLLECFREHFAGECDLHLVTKADLPSTPGVFTHRDIAPHSDAWRERWEQADLFAFPSRLETFGIVLLEAMSFEVPVIASDAGVARQLLEKTGAGWLVPSPAKESLTRALRECLHNPKEARARATRGRDLVEKEFDLNTNTARLAQWLREATART